MRRNMLFTLFVLLSLGLSASCSAGPVTPTPTAGGNLPNPASVFCEQNRGTVELRQDPSGGVAGICVFPDGSECDEWAYFRGECQPGGPALTPVSTPAGTPAGRPTGPAPTRSPETASDGWRIYTEPRLGYRFHYPPDAKIVPNDDPLGGLSILGPSVAGDNWPMIYFSHPGDREDYRPPAGVDLEAWLIDHGILSVSAQQSGSEVRQPDRPIAGTNAIHLRVERSPQTYAFDRYYFAEAQQLYVVVILHTADKEDWDLYDHFLDSIEFDR